MLLLLLVLQPSSSLDCPSDNPPFICIHTILFQMPTPMFLRSSSMLSSHLIAGHPTLLVPYNVANVNILQG
jgi:hypothetical protein